MTFNHLTPTVIREILELELDILQERISRSHRCWVTCTNAAKGFFVSNGFNRTFGARHLVRTLKELVVTPISRFIVGEMIENGDEIEVDVIDGAVRLRKRQLYRDDSEGGRKLKVSYQINSRYGLPTLWVDYVYVKEPVVDVKKVAFILRERLARGGHVDPSVTILSVEER